MTRIFYLGAPAEIRLPATAPVADRLRATRNNVGNLLIGNAIYRQLGPETLCSDLSLPNDVIEQNFDRIVIGASNFLFEGSDKTWMADKLESIKLPCVIIGLGAQAPSYDSAVSVPEGTRRLVKIVAERSKTLGVRGEFTARVLADMGIDNVRVIGCPSMYWTCRPDMRLKSRVDGELRAAVNGSANVMQHSVDTEAARRVEALIARLALNRGYDYVLQAEVELLELQEGGRESNATHLEPLMQRYGLADTSTKTFLRFVREQMKSYWSIDEWFAAISQYDFVIGTRFHGCMIALLAGVPAFVFVHDARTRELCELLKIPHGDVRDIHQIESRALYDSFDHGPMETAHKVLYQNYVEFLDENGINHRLRLPLG